MTEKILDFNGKTIGFILNEATNAFIIDFDGSLVSEFNLMVCNEIIHFGYQETKNNKIKISELLQFENKNNLE